MKIHSEKQVGLFIKLFCNIINDPEIAKMDHQTFRFYIYLHILAKNHGSNGIIKNTLDEICWQLRWQKQDAEVSMNNLLELGFVSKSPGAYIIRDWNASQYTIAYQRVKKFRMKKTSNNDNADDNGGDNTHDNRGDTTEKEKEVEVEGEAEVESRNPHRQIDITENDFNPEIEEEFGEEEMGEELNRDEVEIEDDLRIAVSQNPFEKSNRKDDSTVETGNPAYHILKMFQDEFPLCPWTPDNSMDVIQNKILASKLWTEQEIARGIKELAKKFPKKNATPRHLIGVLQQLTEIGASECAAAERRKKWELIKAEEERILRENEEWRKIHGERQLGQAVREILELIAQREKEDKKKEKEKDKEKVN